MTTIKRRKFTRAAVGGVAAGAAMTTVAAPAISQQRQEWRMVTSWPKMFPGGGTAAERFAKTIGEATGGRLTIKVFAAGELVPAFEAFDAVQRGTADFMHSTPYYWQNKAKILSVFTTVPFGMTNYEIGGVAALRRRPGAVGRDLRPVRPQGLPCRLDQRADGRLVQPARSSRRTTSKASRCASPASAARRCASSAPTIVNLPVGEIFGALQSGAIDATEWVGPWQDLAAGFYKVTKYYYWPGMHEPATLERDHRQQGQVRRPAQGHPADLRLGLRRRACAARPPRTTPTMRARSRP